MRKTPPLLASLLFSLSIPAILPSLSGGIRSRLRLIAILCPVLLKRRMSFFAGRMSFWTSFPTRVTFRARSLPPPLSPEIIPSSLTPPIRRMIPMKRSRISRRKSKRIFRKTAAKPHPLNAGSSSRGGIRL